MGRGTAITGAVIIAAVLVYTLDSRLPDLLIGAMIVLVVFRGGLMIIGEARDELKATRSRSNNKTVQ